MKKTEFNNIEENKFVMGYIHYMNNKNKMIYKKAIGYIVPEENMLFCISSHNLSAGNQNIEDIMFEKYLDNEKLYISNINSAVFELKKYIYPNSKNKISMKELMELTPLLEKYILDEDFDLDENLDNNGYNNCPKLRKVAKQILKQVSV